MMERLYHTCLLCGGLCCSDGGMCPAVMERLYHTCVLCGVCVVVMAGGAQQ